MRKLGLDLSTKVGWAVVDGNTFKDMGVIVYGQIKLKNGTILAYGAYPFCYYLAAKEIAEECAQLIETFVPDEVVIEETNLSKGSRYAQKILEFIHCALVMRLKEDFPYLTVTYLSSSSWRSALELVLSKEQKKANALLSKAKKSAALTGSKVDKAKIGVKGKVTKKHVAIDWVEDHFGFKLKVKDNDIADALCLAAAAFKGAEPCDGT